MATDHVSIPVDESDNTDEDEDGVIKNGGVIEGGVTEDEGRAIDDNRNAKKNVVNRDSKYRPPSLPLDPKGCSREERVRCPFPNTSSDTEKWSIFKVLRQADTNAYEPRVISIGPYHHGKKHLEKMENIKMNCLRRITRERGVKENELKMAMEIMEEDIRQCYPEALFHICEDCGHRFVDMMVLDGCFIVDLFQNRNPKEHFLGLRGTLTEIYTDLLLLENQLPFFVLSRLWGIINKESTDAFARLAVSCLSEVMPPPVRLPENFSGDTKHLLGLVHDCWIPLPQEQEQEREREQVQGTSPKFIRCATELAEAGIRFRKKDRNGLLFDIEFTDDAKLKIPILDIQDDTERILRNFMAYEQFLPSKKPTYVCDYVKFMDNLIDSGKDVQLLRHSGVIVNRLGDDEAVALMFNKLCDFIYTSSETFCYKEIYEKVDGHCQIRSNVWKAKLKKDYFNSPWSLISVIAAVVLLLLTMVQTIFSVLSYVHPK